MGARAQKQTHTKTRPLRYVSQPQSFTSKSQPVCEQTRAMEYVI